MINLPLNELWLPILAFVPIIVAVVKVKKRGKATKDAWFEFIIGVLVLLLSVNDNYNNAFEHKQSSAAISHLDSQVISVQDTLRTTRDTLLKVGIEINQKTGQLLIIDSQLLKKKFTQIIYNNTFIKNTPEVNNDNNAYAIENEKKLTKYFADLDNPDDYKREIAANYIVQNFPTTLNKGQLQIVHKYMFLPGLTRQFMALLADQPPSKQLTSMMRDFLIKKAYAGEKYSWIYLFIKSDIDAPFYLSALKIFPSGWDTFRIMFTYGLESGNSKNMFTLLNSKEVLNYLNSNKTGAEIVYPNVSNQIASNPKYEMFKTTYFFQAMKDQ